jgi:hypothetical protein
MTVSLVCFSVTSAQFTDDRFPSEIPFPGLTCDTSHVSAEESVYASPVSTAASVSMRPTPGSTMSLGADASLDPRRPDSAGGGVACGRRIVFRSTAASSTSLDGYDPSASVSELSFDEESGEEHPCLYLHDPSNLGLVRLFLSYDYAQAYSLASFQEACQRLRRTHYKFLVEQLLGGSADFPGMFELLSATNQEQRVSFEDRVRLFAAGAVKLYIYAFAHGAISSGEASYPLYYVTNHLGIEFEGQSVDPLINQRIWSIVIHIVAGFTEKFRAIAATEHHSLERFWRAISELKSVELEDYSFNDEQQAVLQLMYTYQYHRINQYQSKYREYCCIAPEHASEKCERTIIPNGCT